MNLSIHIEQLILDGISVPSYNLPTLQAAVTRELTRLLADGGLSPGLMAGGAMAYLRGNEFRMPSGDNPDQLGQRIAKAVNGGIGR